MEKSFSEDLSLFLCELFSRVIDASKMDMGTYANLTCSAIAFIEDFINIEPHKFLKILINTFWLQFTHRNSRTEDILPTKSSGCKQCDLIQFSFIFLDLEEVLPL